MLNCGAIAPVIPAPVGVDAAVNIVAPLVKVSIDSSVLLDIDGDEQPPQH
jgi:hypothetical protein